MRMKWMTRSAKTSPASLGLASDTSAPSASAPRKCRSGLEGEADYTKDGAITVNELELYIAERVKALTDGEQTPTMSKPQTIPDFPLAVPG
mgnify:CR=1 FL=1